MTSSKEISCDFDSLVGSSIVEWLASEMALGEGPVIWTHPSIPFLQMISLGARLASGRTICIQSALDTNQGFHGLFFDESALAPRLSEPEPGSIYRDRNPEELPLGCITALQQLTDDEGNVLEVRLSIGGACVELVAGEIYEEAGRRFRIVVPDECVLVRVSGS